MEKITMAELTALFDSVAAIMAENAERLCAMDANMGDGDLGLTMKKGFGALPGLIADIDEADLGKRLAKAGMKMSSVVPSTMGTLMSSGVMEGGKRLSGCEAIGPAEFAGFLEGYAAGIQKRGKCQRGDRTVLDAIGPAADAGRPGCGAARRDACFGGGGRRARRGRGRDRHARYDAQVRQGGCVRRPRRRRGRSGRRCRPARGARSGELHSAEGK